MTTLYLRGDQIGEALQFDPSGTNTAVEIGRTWFIATDVIAITFAPGSFDPVSGQLTGGAGSVVGLTVTSAAGLVTDFGISANNPLDIDPDASKNGAGFFYISESPQPGTGGVYAGLQLEKIVVSSLSLSSGTSPIFDNTTGFLPGGGGVVTPVPAPEPPPTQPDPTPVAVTLTFAGNQIGEALQFDPSGAGTTVEIGRTWFTATDTVDVTFVPGSFNPVTGELIGGAGAIIGLTVTTAQGDVTTFNVSSANPLDIDPDGSKNGVGFFYISETPEPGIGGAYAGVQLEKVLVSGVPLTTGLSPIFDNIGGFIPGKGGGVIIPEPPQPPVVPPVEPPAMTVLEFSGNQVAEALQFDPSGTTTTVEIGRSWFAATDKVAISFAPDSFDPTTGELIGGAGSITGFTVTTLEGQVTTFNVSAANPLDIDPDASKNGAGFFYISESPEAGQGGAYSGLQIEKLVVADVPLVTGTSPIFDNQTGFAPSLGVLNMAAVDTMALSTNLIQGTGQADVLTGTSKADHLEGLSGNDRLSGGNGNDVLSGGAGVDVLTGGKGADVFVFGANDRVTDFKLAEGDRIKVGATDGVLVNYTSKGVLISLSGEHESMLLKGVSSSGFDPSLALVYEGQLF